jgi:sterol desaturase/sphingolipid hydroxylase (fatty acid hydroxylase superfamily)
MALLMHNFMPYDIEAARGGWALDWALRRFGLNLGVSFAYYGFFFAGLYLWGWSDRKFAPGSFPTVGNMLHNFWYWTLGIAQWTCWECVVMRLWATGKVPFVSNAEVMASSELLAWNLLWVLVVPVWRDLHFYIAHRFCHVRAVYRFVHALHHRNPDPEPFSGITMHPIEHVYYFSNALMPTLFLGGLSPFVFLWLYVHLAISPAAGHSGWEDHFQSDQYHFLHHAKFECNYGSPFSGFIDQWCGTFREHLGRSEQYTGEWSHDVDAKKPTAKEGKVWSKEGQLGLPADWAHGVYTLFWVALWAAVGWAAVLNHGADRVTHVGPLPIGKAMGLLAGYGPVVLALVLCAAAGDRLSWRWPFQKESLFGTFGLFIALGWFACINPVARATELICA